MGSYTDFWFDFKLVNSPYEVRNLLMNLQRGRVDHLTIPQHPYFQDEYWHRIFDRMDNEPQFVEICGSNEWITTTVKGFTCVRGGDTTITLFLNWLKPWIEGQGIWNYLGCSFNDTYDHIPALYFNPVGPFGPDEPHFPDDNKNGWVRI
jgi:hypothetical protein